MDTPIARAQQPYTPFITKFMECFFAGVACINILLMTASLWPRTALRGTIFSYLMLGQLLTGIVFAISYAPYWHRQERKNRIDTGLRHAWLRGILRYWLAMEIALYGFAKLLKTQFAISYSRNDTPVSHLNGFDLTWNYFGYSYTLAVILGLLQIFGCILLLFRRTTLFGIVLLLPIMVNIVLINLFYHIAAGAFLNSILFTAGLSYLLLLRKSALMSVFWVPSTDLPEVRLGFLKNVFRLLSILISFSTLFYVVRKNPISPMAGKWSVQRIIRNRDTLKTNAWLTDSTAWSTVYIEERNILSLCPNPYFFDDHKSQVVRYIYDSVRHQLQLIPFKNTKDTSRLQVLQSDSRNMQWSGIIDGDTLSMQLFARP